MVLGEEGESASLGPPESDASLGRLLLMCHQGGSGEAPAMNNKFNDVCSL